MEDSVEFNISFMSEEVPLYLESIGLLGQYCPTSRKRYRNPLDSARCMHLKSSLKSTSVEDFCWMQPFPIAGDIFSIQDRPSLSSFDSSFSLTTAILLPHLATVQ